VSDTLQEGFIDRSSWICTNHA